MNSNISMICSFIVLSLIILHHGTRSFPVSFTRAIPQPWTKATTLQTTNDGTLLPPTFQAENRLMDNMVFNIIMVSTVAILLAITLCLCAIKYRHKDLRFRRQNVSQESLLPNGLLESSGKLQSDKLQSDKPPAYDVIIVDKNVKKVPSPINVALPPSYVEALHSTEVKLPLPETHTHI